MLRRQSVSQTNFNCRTGFTGTGHEAGSKILFIVEICLPSEHDTSTSAKAKRIVCDKLLAMQSPGDAVARPFTLALGLLGMVRERVSCSARRIGLHFRASVRLGGETVSVCSFEIASTVACHHRHCHQEDRSPFEVSVSRKDEKESQAGRDCTYSTVLSACVT